VHSKTQNSISIVKTNSLVESQEFEISARSLILVDASLISVQLTLKFGRSIIKMFVITSYSFSR
jgi:hypothetical protein